MSGGLTIRRPFCKISRDVAVDENADAAGIVVMIGIKSSTMGGRKKLPGCRGRGYIGETEEKANVLLTKVKRMPDDSDDAIMAAFIAGGLLIYCLRRHVHSFS